MSALPVLRDDKSAPFFEAAASGDLVVRRCDACSQWLPPEAIVCTTCAGTVLSWAGAAGTGSVVTWTVVHRAPNRSYVDVVPYTVGVVELDEGPWLYALLEIDTPRVGQRVRAVFAAVAEGETYPVFTQEDLR